MGGRKCMEKEGGMREGNGREKKKGGRWRQEKKMEACEGGLVKEELKGGRWRQDR